jgi:hypothetical protein
MAFFATAVLALAVLFRSSASDHRIVLCIIVSAAATTVIVRCLFNGKLVWTLPFLGVLGLFTPFQVGRFSHPLISILDMASMVLFAASPMILRESTMTVARPGRF